jgi:hypothetical protein
LSMLPPIACVHLAVYMATVWFTKGAAVYNRGAPHMGGVWTGNIYIWQNTCIIMFWRCVNDLLSNYHCQAQNRV